jgi:hypothetical protein
MSAKNPKGGKTRIGEMKPSRDLNYFQNVAKEYMEWRRSNPKPGPSDEVGQFYGALLKGRRYNKKGEQI